MFKVIKTTFDVANNKTSSSQEGKEESSRSVAQRRADRLNEKQMNCPIDNFIVSFSVSN